MINLCKDIITNLPKNSTLYLSFFTPEEILIFARSYKIKVALLPSTLQGLIDIRSIKAFDTKENAVIINYPFEGNHSDDALLDAMQESHHFKLYKLSPVKNNESKAIQHIFHDALKASKDLDLGAITASNHLAVFLHPHMFCPKEEIVNGLKEAGVVFYTELPDLYKLAPFESDKKSFISAYECSLSFLALDCRISEDEALKNAQSLLTILESHSLRRCTF